jgi:glycosyltransferase involved in cell wall biosynthesis
MPRLIFIHPSDELYGADRVLLEILKVASARYEQLEVWLPTDLPHPESQMALCQTLTSRGVAVRHLDLPVLRRAYRNAQGMMALAWRAARTLAELRRAKPAIVYCTTSAAFLAAPLARLVGVPKVIGHLQEIWSRGDARMLAFPAHCCHTLLAISRAVASSLPGSLEERATIVANATPDPEHVIPLVGRHGPLRFLVASRWNGWKGHRTLLAAWDQANSPGHLLVLGGPPLNGESVDVRALVAQLHHPDSVSIVGEVSDPSPYIDEADVVLVPSEQAEPFGLVAIEAFAHARPVVGTRAGGLLDIVTQGQDGWLLPAGDVESWAHFLGSLTREDVTRAGWHARQTFSARYTSARFSRDWHEAVR